MSDGVLFLLVLLLISGAVFIPGTLIEIRRRRRMHRAVKDAEALIASSSWAEARRMLESVVDKKASGPVKPADRQLRYLAECSLIRVCLMGGDSASALERLDAFDAHYTPTTDMATRANSAYLRSLVLDGLGDAAGARQMGQRARSLCRECDAPAVLEYLQAMSANERITEAYQLLKRRRPTAALRDARTTLQDMEMSVEQKRYVEAVAGTASQTLGDLATANKYFESILAAPHTEKEAGIRAQAAMNLVVNATLAADREHAQSLMATAESMFGGLDVLDLYACLYYKYRSDQYWDGNARTREVFAEIESAAAKVEDAARRKVIETGLELIRLGWRVWSVSSADERYTLIAEIEEARADSETAEEYLFYLGAMEARLFACGDSAA